MNISLSCKKDALNGFGILFIKPIASWVGLPSILSENTKLTRRASEYIPAFEGRRIK